MYGAVSGPRLLSFKPRVPLEGEGARRRRACERVGRAPSEPSGSLAETGPFSFLVIIEIGPQVLLLSRGAPLALITPCLAALRTRSLNFKLPLWNGYSMCCAIDDTLWFFLKQRVSDLWPNWNYRMKDCWGFFFGLLWFWK